MKEIVLIMTHAPTYEKQKLLINLVDKLLESGYKIAIASHTTIPQNIIERIDYFFYEKENKLIFDPALSYWSYFKSGNLWLDYKAYGSMSTHILPIFSMFFSSLSFLSYLDFDIVHHIEYDSIIENCDFLKSNKDRLSEGYDSVLYFSDEFKNKENAIFGPIFSFNLKKINLENLKYDEIEILKNFEEILHKKYHLPTETLIYEMLFSKINNLWVDVKVIPAKLDISSYESKYIKNNCTFNIHNGIVHFFSHNDTDKSKEILIILDGLVFKEFTQIPGNWCWQSTGKRIEEIKKIKLFIDNQLVKELNLEKQEDLDYIIKWSKITMK